MANIVLGIATSHGPMLATPPDQWGQRVDADRRNPELYFNGRPLSFDQLLEVRRAERLDKQLTKTSSGNASMPANQPWTSWPACSKGTGRTWR